MPVATAIRSVARPTTVARISPSRSGNSVVQTRSKPAASAPRARPASGAKRLVAKTIERRTVVVSGGAGSGPGGSAGREGEAGPEQEVVVVRPVGGVAEHRRAVRVLGDDPAALRLVVVAAVPVPDVDLLDVGLDLVVVALHHLALDLDGDQVLLVHPPKLPHDVAD